MLNLLLGAVVLASGIFLFQGSILDYLNILLGVANILWFLTNKNRLPAKDRSRNPFL